MPILPLMKYDVRSSLEDMGWGEETKTHRQRTM